MADRIIRDELWHSVRWLDLPTDTHRLVYLSLIPIADDYGNVEGGSRRLYRWMIQFTQIKSEADALKLMSDLQDADLVRRYEVIHKEYWHLPRFKNTRQYWSRKYPKSPFIEQEIPKNQQHRQKLHGRLTEHSANPQRGVGVGVGVGVGKVKHTVSSADADSVFEEFWKTYPRKTAKAAARKAWTKLKGNVELAALVEAINSQSQTEQWQRGVIPHASTWLNQHRWEDDAETIGLNLGRCAWNANGTREPGRGQCTHDAAETRGTLAYCTNHAQQVNA